MKTMYFPPITNKVIFEGMAVMQSTTVPSESADKPGQNPTGPSDPAPGRMLYV